MLYVSHDRELLAQSSHKVVTIEAHGAWTHGDSFATWHNAREKRLALISDEQRRWAEERKRLVNHLREQKRRAAMSDANAKRAKAAETRLRHFDEAGPPPELAREQRIDVRLDGGRTGKRGGDRRAARAHRPHLPVRPGGSGSASGWRWWGATAPASRTSCASSAAERSPTTATGGSGRGWCRVCSARPTSIRSTWAGHRSKSSRVVISHAGRRCRGSDATSSTAPAINRGRPSRAASRRGFRSSCSKSTAPNLLLLDEPTDNLDVASAEALQAGLEVFEGTVVCVTHDRWFLRTFDRFVAFADDAEVREVDDPAAAWAS